MAQFNYEWVNGNNPVSALVSSRYKASSTISEHH